MVDYFLVADFYLLVEDFYLLAVDSYFVAADSCFEVEGFYFWAVTLAALVQPGVRLLARSQYQWHYTKEYYKDMP